jgi:phenylalanyl-tRNA synthetase beta chain
MEYSLQNLNKNAQLNNLTINEIIDTLNLIGFEVDDIFTEKSPTNCFSDNIRVLIKIPSNREDLLNETFLLQDLSAVLLFQLYKTWEKIKPNYYFILKQKYYENYNYQSIDIESELSDLVIYSIPLKAENPSYSPIWVQNKLKNLGLPFQNNINDIVELVKFEWGQSFQSLNLGKSKNLVLKKLSESQRFKNSEDKEYELKEGTLVLTNEKNEILTFLGLMNINLSQTKNGEIYIQGLYYDIHENALQLNPLQSILSLRHLRNEFLENFKFAFQRLLTLFDVVYSMKCYPKMYSCAKRPTKLNPRRILKLEKQALKKTLNLDTFDSKIFKKAGLKIICRTPKELYFDIPNARNDLRREIDLIEEYSRFIGYKNFPEILPRKTFVYSNTKSQAINYLKQFFLNCSFSEIITSPIKSKEYQKKSSVLITNPLTSELSNLRTELLSELAQNFETNLRLTTQSISLFEIGRVFQKTEMGILEIDKFGGVFQVEKRKKGKIPNTEWFVAKGVIENFLKNFGYTEENLTIESIKGQSLMLHQTKSITIKFKNKIIGIFGELTPHFEKLKSAKFSIYLFEFDLRYFENWRMNSVISTYQEPSKYPVIIKDLSFTIEKATNFSFLKREIKKQSSFLKEIHFFDVYFEEKDLSSINLGVRLFFQSSSQTLKTEQVDIELQKISTFLIDTFSIQFKS